MAFPSWRAEPERDSSGGAIAEHGGIVVALTRMTSILEIDEVNRLAVVEPGVVNIDLTAAASKYGLYYAPDPSSQKACTIGGNVAENSGGPHCLAYGVTTNHVLGMEVVLADGSVHWYGGKTREAPGYDLRGIMIGSEGTLGIVTKVVVRLLKSPESVKTLLAMFKTVEDASSAVSGIIGAGIVPAAIEMMDAMCIQAAEASMNAGYPEEAGAVLLVEVDGLREEVEEEAEEIANVCRTYEPMEILTATSSEERERLWAARKGVIGALGWLAPNYYLVDGTVPRTKLMEVLGEVEKVAQRSRDFPSPICSMPVTGTCTRSFSSMSASPETPTERWKRAAGYWRSALTRAACCRENTASAWRSRSTCRSCSRRKTWTRWRSSSPPSGRRRYSTPARSSQPAPSHGARHPEGGFAKTAANAFV